MHGIGSHLEVKQKEITKNKKRMPTKTLKQKRATLKETQALIGNEMSKDERGIKEKNPRKSVCTIEKWLDTGRWEEIVKEGEDASAVNSEKVRLIHVPNSISAQLPEPEPPPGFHRRTFEAKTGGPIYSKLLDMSTMAFTEVSKYGRNMSSMTTPLQFLVREMR